MNRAPIIRKRSGSEIFSSNVWILKSILIGINIGMIILLIGNDSSTYDFQASIADDWELIYQTDVYLNDGSKIPLFLVDQFPEVIEKRTGACVNNDRIVGCWTGNSIYIINGTEGLRGEDTTGGCSVLWHEIKHADGFDHYKMKQVFPNELCSATHYPLDKCFQVFDPFCRR